MRQSRVLLTASLVLVTLLPHVSALHCNGTIITVSAGGETLYIDDRSDEAGELDHWFYLEANGTPGLQSGGEDIWLGKDPYFPHFSDPCGHVDPDSLIL